MLRVRLTLAARSHWQRARRADDTKADELAHMSACDGRKRWLLTSGPGCQCAVAKKGGPHESSLVGWRKSAQA